MRIGIGYDIHKLNKKKKLILGGVLINTAKFGAQGHSDADCLIHSICDAILSAIGKQDIGFYFPDNDPDIKNINSSIIAKKTLNILKKQGYTISNISSIIILQKPKLAKFRGKIILNLSKIFKIKQSQIGISFKTNENLESVGEGRAIKCYSTCIIKKVKKI